MSLSGVFQSMIYLKMTVASSIRLPHALATLCRSLELPGFPEFGSNELAVSCFNQELERVLLPIVEKRTELEDAIVSESALCKHSPFFTSLSRLFVQFVVSNACHPPFCLNRGPRCPSCKEQVSSFLTFESILLKSSCQMMVFTSSFSWKLL